MIQVADRKPISAKDVVVRQDDCHFVQGEAIRLVTFGLGSDVALIASAPAIGLAALLRFTRPVFREAAVDERSNPWRFADTAVPLLLAGFRDRGADDQEITLRSVGGSDLDQAGQIGSLGAQNSRSMRGVLWREGLLLKGHDLGENLLRSIWYDPVFDRLLVRASRFSEAGNVSIGPSAATRAS